MSRAYRQRVRHTKGSPDTGAGDILIVVDVQKDFCDPTAEHLAHLYVEQTDSLVSALNELLREAQKREVPIVFARDWHPADHASFAVHQGEWREHCVAGTAGAEFHPRLEIGTNPRVANIGEAFKGRDYTPFLDKAFIEFVEGCSPHRVLVTGIALEYCVLATCLDALAHVQNVMLLEEYVRAADSSTEIAETIRKVLVENGVQIVRTFSLSNWR